MFVDVGIFFPQIAAGYRGFNFSMVWLWIGVLVLVNSSRTPQRRSQQFPPKMDSITTGLLEPTLEPLLLREARVKLVQDPRRFG